MRNFETGATRDTDDGKFDYESFLSPEVIEAFGAYMHECRRQADGSYRDGDNWQRGIPQSVYMKSLWRHFHTCWKHHRQGKFCIKEWMAMLFNVQGYVFEQLKKDAFTEMQAHEFQKNGLIYDGPSQESSPVQDDNSGTFPRVSRETCEQTPKPISKGNILKSNNVRLSDLSLRNQRILAQTQQADRLPDSESSLQRVSVESRDEAFAGCSSRPHFEAGESLPPELEDALQSWEAEAPRWPTKRPD